MRLLIATWGEPSLWNKVRYSFQDRKEEGCSTLKLLKEVLRPDKTILLVNDTLVGRERDINKNCPKSQQGKLIFKGQTYNDVIEFVKDYIYQHSKAFDASVNKSDIWVLPSVGFFPNAIAKGELSDLRYQLFVDFFKFFDELLEAKKVEIYLDITHGQNFLPTFTFEVLDTVLGILAFFVNEIKLTVLNSDPFVPKANPSLLEIHKVIERKFQPKPYLYYRDRFNFLAPISKINMAQILKPIQEVKENEIPIKLIEKVPAFLGAIYNALPLVVFYSYLNPAKVEKLLDTALGVYKNNILIREEEGKIILDKLLKLTPDVEVFAIYGMFLKGLKKKYPFLEEISYYKAKDENREYKVSLEHLKEIAKFLSYNGKNEAFLEKEIEDFEANINRYMTENRNFDWTRYKEIKNSEEKGKQKAKEEPQKSKDGAAPKGNEKRNFLAHAGLSENSIMVKAEKGRVYLRYVSEKENKDINVFEWAREGLKRI